MTQDYPGKGVPATNYKPSNASRTNLTPRYCNHIHNLRTLVGPTVTPTSTEQPAHPPLHPFLGHHLAAIPTISSLQATAVDTYASRAFAPRPMVTQRCIMSMGPDGRRLFADFDHHRSVACLLWPLISPDDRMIQIGSWMGRVKHYWVCSWSRFWLYPSPWFTTGLSSRPLGMTTE